MRKNPGSYSFTCAPLRLSAKSLSEVVKATIEALTARLVRTVAILAALLFFAACAARPVEKASSIEDLPCIPKNEASTGPSLSVVSAIQDAENIRVRVMAKAGPEATVFELPVYRLSAGRWLIGSLGRSYLLDELCREYRMNDRKSPRGEKIPLDGKIRLRPEESFEAELFFPKLIPPLKFDASNRKKTINLALVYEKRVLAIRLSPEF